MEENTVLIVVPRIENLLIPDDASISGRYIHHLQPVGVAHKVIGEHYGALQASVCPFRAVRVGNV